MNIIHLDKLTDYVEPVANINNIKEMIDTTCRQIGVPVEYCMLVENYPSSNCGLSLVLNTNYDVYKLLMWIGRYAWDDDMMELLSDVVVEECLVDGYLGKIIHFVNIEESS